MSKRPLDRDGRSLRVGSVVRIVGLPNLDDMPSLSRRESMPVFRHILGTYKRIVGFNRRGQAELEFRIARGRHRGYHWVWIETSLLKLRKTQRS